MITIWCVLEGKCPLYFLPFLCPFAHRRQVCDVRASFFGVTLIPYSPPSYLILCVVDANDQKFRISWFTLRE